MEYVKTDMPSPSVEERREIWQNTQNDSLYNVEMNKILLPTFLNMLQMHRQLKAKYPEFGPAYVKRYFEEHPLEEAQLIEKRGEKPARMASLGIVGFNENELDDVIILDGCQEAYRYYQSNLSVFGDIYSMIMNSCGSEDTYLRTVYQLLYGIVSPPNSYLSDAFISVGKNYHNLILGGGCETLHSLVEYAGGGDSNGFRFHFIPGLWSATRGNSGFWPFVFEQANICDDIMDDYWDDYWGNPWGDGGGGQSSGGLSSLFNTGNLDKDQFEKLKKEYEKMLEECVYAAINNQLLSSNIELGDVLIDPTLLGVGAISSAGNFIVQDINTIGVSTFKHEWIHLYQHYLQGINVFGNLQGMAEFEVAVFRDIEIYSNINNDNDLFYRLQNISLGYSSWIHNAAILEDIRNGYINWIASLSTGSIDLSTPASVTAFQNWASLFGQYGPYRDKGYQYSGVNYDFRTLNELIEILNNCKQ